MKRGFALAAAAAALWTGLATMPEARAGERTVTLAVENLWCVSCAYILRSSLEEVPGVSEVEIDSIDRDDVGTTRIVFDDEAVSISDLVREIAAAGYPATVVAE